MSTNSKPAGRSRRTVNPRSRGGIGALSKVFILEDDVEQLKALAIEFDPDVRWEVHALRSPKAMIDKLEATYTNTDGLPVRAHVPLLAVIDLNMQYALDNSKSSYDVLRYLWHHHRDETAVIVYSAELDSVNVRDRLQEAHPRAWWRDKTDLPSRFVSRDVANIIHFRYGDIEHSAGVVKYVGLEPGDAPATPNFFVHRVAALLMFAQQRGMPLELQDDETAVRAVSRFNKWLAGAGSVVRVRSLGGWRYFLGIDLEQTQA